MDVKILGTAQIGAEIRRLIGSSEKIMLSVAWATGGPHAEALMGASSRIDKVAVGIDFCLTDPNILERLIAVPKARVVTSLGTVFHPKIYYFEKGADAHAIVGSSNFTRGGTINNFEAAVMLSSVRSDEAMVRVRAMIDEAWRAGEPIDQNFVQRYRLSHEAAQRRRPTFPVAERVAPSGRGAPSPLLAMNWADYVSGLRGSTFHNPNEGVALLRQARKIFASASEFRDLSEEERRAIAGVLPIKAAAVGGISAEGWKMFGAMRGSGVFVQAIAQNNPGISAALNCIPEAGEVEKDDYFAFADAFSEAFSEAARQAGVPPATRLLAMKRPDTFLCVDGRNWDALRRDLGGRKKLPDWDLYWTGVIEPLRTSRWYNAPRPRGAQAAFWDRRMALLDSIIYSE